MLDGSPFQLDFSENHVPSLKPPRLRPRATKLPFLSIQECKVICKVQGGAVQRRCRYEPLSAQPLVLVLCQVRFSPVRQMEQYIPAIQDVVSAGMDSRSSGLARFSR